MSFVHIRFLLYCHAEWRSAADHVVYLDRAASRVRETQGCWYWTGGTGTGGYGRFRVRGVLTGPHRFIHEVTKGPIPAGWDVHHHCDTPACIFPGHLEALSKQEHSQYRERDDRGRFASRRRE